jgi:hypothetical protein
MSRRTIWRSAATIGFAGLAAEERWIRNFCSAMRSHADSAALVAPPVSAASSGRRMAARHLDRFAQADNCSDETAPLTADRAPLGKSFETVAYLGGTESSNPLPSSGESRANLKTTSAFRCRVETARNRAMAFRGHLLTRLRAFRHACRGSGVNHSGLSRRWALAPPQPAEAFSDRGIPVGADG